jgi:ABC-2 type transport system ATP-binding protein
VQPLSVNADQAVHPTAGSEPAVEVRDLVKVYGERRAVDGIDLRIGRGEIFALLGRNGAGKTTTVEILEGIRRADSGQVRVLGLDPTRRAQELKTRIGVMLQDGGLYPAITAREALVTFAGFYPQSRPADELLELVGLEDSAGVRYRRLSGGQKQRLRLALALVGGPELLFLDEPTTGLDPQARRAAWELVESLRAQGITVLLTTHYLEEAERLADRVAIMDAGRIVASGTPASLVQGDRTLVRLRTASQVATEVLRALPHVTAVREEAGGYRLETQHAPDLLVSLTATLRDLDVSILDLRVGQGTLEDLFLTLTEGEEA